jgi:hypothetical protein
MDRVGIARGLRLPLIENELVKNRQMLLLKTYQYAIVSLEERAW